MITLEEAKRIAEDARGRGVNYCEEYKDAYLLYGKDDPMSRGGTIQPIAVMKEDGTKYGYTGYIRLHDYEPGEPETEYAV